MHEKYNSTSGQYRSWELFERCSKSHFPNMDNSTYYNYNLNFALCMPKDY